MERDAFVSLFSQPQGAGERKSNNSRSKHVPSSKRPRSSTSPSAASRAGSRFVECPLCGKSVHSSLAQAHVARCPGKEEDTNPTAASKAADTQAAKQGQPIFALASTDVSSSHQEVNGKVDCYAVASPVEKGCMSVARVSPSPVAETAAGPDHERSSRIGERRLGEEVGEETTRSSINTGSDKIGNGGQSRGGTSCSCCCSSSSSKSISCASNTSKNNVFATLMAASALTNFREEMYLLAHQDGTLSWGWGPAGNPLPPPFTHSENRRWRCQVATKGPDGRKAGMCDVWTNLPPADSVADSAMVAAGRGGGRLATGGSLAGGDDNAGLKAARPSQSLSRLPVAVVKSMLQKNVRRGRAEAAVRCALELALKSWSDAIRRILVIVVEDSLLHPAAPFLSWLMVATSKGYRPPPRLLEAFLCVVHETAACPVRDSTYSSRRRRRSSSSRSSTCSRNDRLHEAKNSTSVSTTTSGQEQEQQQQPPMATKSYDADEFPVPHPKKLLVSGIHGDQTDLCGSSTKVAAAPGNAAIAVANIRRALLMRVSYGGMACDQALLKGACLAWGERCGHLCYCCCRGAINPSFACAATAAGSGDGSCSGSDAFCSDVTKFLGSGELAATIPGTGSARRAPSQHQPPDPPWFKCKASSLPGPPDEDTGNGNRGDRVDFPPFGYAHESMLSALQGNGWTAFLAAAHAGTGMPPALRAQLVAHVAGGAGVREAGQQVGNTKQQTSGGGGEGGGGGGAVAKAPSTAIPPNRLGPIMREADAILSGVDFHCSSVLDELLRSTAVAARVGKAMSKTRENRVKDKSDAYNSEVNIVGVRQAAKRAMWACSGGLNVRRLRVAFSQEEEQDMEGCQEGGGGDEGSEGSCDCCLSNPGFLEETAREAPTGDDVLSPGEDGRGSSCGMNERVWIAMSSDVLGWTTKFVRGRLAKG